MGGAHSSGAYADGLFSLDAAASAAAGEEAGGQRDCAPDRAPRGLEEVRRRLCRGGTRAAAWRAPWDLRGSPLDLFNLRLGFTRLRKAGSGTYSEVYAVRCNQTGALRAIKRVRLNVAEPLAVAFAAREVRALRRLRHPNVLRLHALAVARPDAGDDALCLHLVLDYYERDLAGVLAALGGQLPQAAAKAIAYQTLQGLAALHGAGIIHRDLKASNLLLDAAGRLVIADLGLACTTGALGAPPPLAQPAAAQAAQAAAGVAPLTSRVITLWYRPPELLLGCTSYGAEVDLWSAGALLAELLSGKPLLPGRTEVEQLHRTLQLCGSEGALPVAHAPGRQPPPACALSAALAAPRVPYPRRLGAQLAAAGLEPEAAALVERLLSVTPGERGTALQALTHPYFAEPPASSHAAMPHLPACCLEAAVQGAVALVPLSKAPGAEAEAAARRISCDTRAREVVAPRSPAQRRGVRCSEALPAR